MRLRRFKPCWLHVRIIPGERTLLEQLPSCFQMYQSLTADDRAAIRQVLPILISGMEMDLDRFPGESESQLTALSSMEELDDYIYKVAGCVGEFWTDLMCAHLPRIRRHWNREAKRQIGRSIRQRLATDQYFEGPSHGSTPRAMLYPVGILSAGGLTTRRLAGEGGHDEIQTHSSSVGRNNPGPSGSRLGLYHGHSRPRSPPALSLYVADSDCPENPAPAHDVRQRFRSRSPVENFSM